jgi:hypothetical protein
MPVHKVKKGMLVLSDQEIKDLQAIKDLLGIKGLLETRETRDLLVIKVIKGLLEIKDLPDLRVLS